MPGPATSVLFPGRSAGRLRVLLVNDSPFNRRMGAELLKEMGHDVATARDGPEAIDLDREGAFDLVLMDIQMIGMDGYEATIHLRRNQERAGRHAPIVALTAQATGSDRARCLAAGMDGHLSKPLSRRGLDRIIHGEGPEDRPRSPHPCSPWSRHPDEIRGSFPMTGRAMARVVALFRESCVERIDEMRDALDARDGPALAGAAHALRGSLAMFAGPAALDLVRGLEARGKSGDLPGSGAILDRLGAVIASLAPTLDDLASDPG